MTSDEGMMNAARVMREAAATNQRAADCIAESVRQMQMLFDAGYGGTAPRLLEELEKASNHWSATSEGAAVTPAQPKPPNLEPVCPDCGADLDSDGRCTRGCGEGET